MASSQRVGRVIDLSWAPLPQPVGGGSVVALALEDGSLAFADTSQALEQSSRKQRMQAFKHLLGGSWPYPQVGMLYTLVFITASVLILCCLVPQQLRPVAITSAPVILPSHASPFEIDACTSHMLNPPSLLSSAPHQPSKPHCLNLP